MTHDTENTTQSDEGPAPDIDAEAFNDALIGSAACMRDLIGEIFVNGKTALSAGDICELAARHGLMVGREVTAEEVEAGAPVGGLLVLTPGFQSVVEMIEQAFGIEVPDCADDGEAVAANAEPALASG